MFKKIATALVAALLAASSFAAVEANKGTAAELDGLKGVGPAMSRRIVDARAQGEFKDWADFMHRVKGVKDKSAAKLSSEGLTINGQAFTPTSKDEGKKQKKSGKGAASEPGATAAATASAPSATAPAAAAAAPATPATPAAATAPAAAAAAAGVPAMKAAVTPVAVQAAPAVAGAAAAAPAAKAAPGK